MEINEKGSVFYIKEEEYKEYQNYKYGNIPKKWCWVKFITGWISKSFLAWIVTTIMVNDILLKSFMPPQSELEFTYIDLPVVIVWGVVTVCFILGKSIETAVSNAKLSLEMKAGASINKEIKDRK